MRLQAHVENLLAEADARMGGEEWGKGTGVDRLIRAMASIRADVSKVKGILEAKKKGGEVDWQEVSETLQRAHEVFGQAADAAQVAANKQGVRKQQAPSPKKSTKRGPRRLKRK